MRARSEQGFSLVDVCVTLSVSVIMLYALHSGTRTAIRTRQTVESQYQLHLYAAEFLSRIRRLPYGNIADPAPSATQLQELFDADQDLGSITASQLVVPPTDDGLLFTMSSREIRGTWRVRVTHDVNGDGDTTDAREGRQDLMRIEIYYQDRLMFESLRAADPIMTSGEVVDYTSGLPTPDITDLAEGVFEPLPAPPPQDGGLNADTMGPGGTSSIDASGTGGASGPGGPGG